MNKLSELMTQAQERLKHGGNWWDGLHPDLVPYLIPSRVLGTILQAPLVVDIMPIAEICNYRYESKRAAMAEATAAEDWDRVFVLYERPWRLTKLWEAWLYEQMPLEALREQLAWVWTDAESPLKALTPGDVIAMFRDVGYISDSDQPQPLSGTRLYRGCSPRYTRGVSWSLDPKQALWFANRWSGSAGAPAKNRVYYADVKPKDILGIFVGRGEWEVVVDSHNIRPHIFDTESLRRTAKRS